MLRSASSKRLSTAVASRVNNTSVRCIQGKPGDVASGNSSFAKKEKALEDMFFRQQDAARLKKLREHPELLEAEKNKFVKTKLSEEKGGSAGKH